MKIEIETACNGYIITMPPEYEDSIEKKIVVQDDDDDDSYANSNELQADFKTFSNLVEQLQEIFGIHNSKHNAIGYINGLCSENIRCDTMDNMIESLKNPKNDTGD